MLSFLAQIAGLDHSRDEHFICYLLQTEQKKLVYVWAEKEKFHMNVNKLNFEGKSIKSSDMRLKFIFIFITIIITSSLF